MPDPTAPRSRTITVCPRAASSYAVDRPAIPEPTTTVSELASLSRGLASGATRTFIQTERLRSSPTFICASAIVVGMRLATERRFAELRSPRGRYGRGSTRRPDAALLYYLVELTPGTSLSAAAPCSP